MEPLPNVTSKQLQLCLHLTTPCILTDATSGWMLEPLLSVMRKCCAVTVLVSTGQLNTTGMPLACEYLHTSI